MRLYRHPVGVYMARDEESGLYFPKASHMPYIVVFIGYHEFNIMMAQIRSRSIDLLSMSLQKALQEIPGFRVDGERVCGPYTYARVEKVELDGPFFRVDAK